MNTNYQSQISSDSPLATQGGRFILHIHTSSQLLASLVGPLFGVYFIYITANFSQNQFLKFLVSMASAILLVNILHAIYARMITKQARLRLDHIFKNRSLPDGSNELSAWDEIIAFPRRSSIAQVVLVSLLVIAPVILFMHWSGGVNLYQIISIIIGGSLSAMAALVQGFLFLDTQLSPARRALLPADPSHQDIRISVGQRARQYFVTSILLLMAILTVGGVGYQKFLALKAPGSNPEIILFQYQTQLIVIGIAIFIVGTFLASRLAQAISLPTKEIIRVMERVKKGDYSERAQIMNSDDMAQLTIRLNQMLDQLQVSQTGLEKQIEERTKDLTRKTSYLQAAAWVAHEAAGLQDINTLLARTVELISSRFNFYHTGIFLLDDSGEHAVLQAASSEGGQRMLARGHRLDVGLQGLVGTSAYQNRSQVVMDVENDKNYYQNPDLPLTRSEAAIPLTARGKILGVLDIQSTEPSAFSQDDIDLLQAMADQIGLAIQNARLIAESQDALQRLETATAENVHNVWQERVRGNKHSYRYTSMGLTPVTQLGNMPTVSETASNRLNVPITLRGQPIGTIVLQRTAENAWSETDRSLSIEGQVGLALENARLLDEAQQRAEREFTISEIASKISGSVNLRNVLRTTVQELGRALPETEIIIQLQSDQGKESN